MATYLGKILTSNFQKLQVLSKNPSQYSLVYKVNPIRPLTHSQQRGRGEASYLQEEEEVSSFS